MAPHYFDHHHSAVTGGGSVQPIEPIDYDINGGIESERRGSGFKIIVDGFGDADAIDTSLLQLLRRHQRTVTSYDDQRLDLKLV
jgi:hypothetical protein